MNYELNPILMEEPTSDSELKGMIVDYVGNKYLMSGDLVTVELIMEAMSKEFPEFLLALAEENFFRGYTQALSDVNDGDELMRKTVDEYNKIEKENEHEQD
jgi:hypothetical protein